MSIFRNAALAGLGLGLTVLMPAAAVAANAYATTNVNERAGPGTDYPVVTLIPAGATVTIFGCLSGIAWCDVAFADTRGWVQGDYLQALYEARRVPVPVYAPRLGVPIVTFSIVYWDNHYRHRPFYRERARFYRLHANGPGRRHPGAVIYLNTPHARVIGAVGKGPRYAAGGGPRRFARVAGPNRVYYAKPGKGPKQKFIRAQLRGQHKPIYAKAKGPQLRKKPGARRCVTPAGRRIC